MTTETEDELDILIDALRYYKSRGYIEGCEELIDYNYDETTDVHTPIRHRVVFFLKIEDQDDV